MGAYLTIYGYESPGGGFQAGGVIFAVSVILLMTAYGYRRTRKHFPPLRTVQLVESSAALFIVGGTAIAGLAFGAFFFNFLRPYIPGGTVMTFNIGVALKVGGTSFVLVFYILSRWVDRD